jgi:hypothetical protein
MAKGLSHLILVRLVTGEPRRRLAHKIALHKAASEVRYIVNFNNGSTTEPNGVSEFILTAHMAPVVTTTGTHRLKEGSESPKSCHRSPTFAPRLPLAGAEQDHQFRGSKIC